MKPHHISVLVIATLLTDNVLAGDYYDRERMFWDSCPDPDHEQEQIIDKAAGVALDNGAIVIQKEYVLVSAKRTGRRIKRRISPRNNTGDDFFSACSGPWVNYYVMERGNRESAVSIGGRYGFTPTGFTWMPGSLTYANGVTGFVPDSDDAACCPSVPHTILFTKKGEMTREQYKKFIKLP